jgi:pilus assembly protein CpaE
MESRGRGPSIGAFVANDQARAGLEAALASRACLGKPSLAVRTGGLPAALSFCAHNKTPEILVVDADAEGEALVAGVDRLAEVCDAGTRLIVVGRSNDVGLYRTLLRRGVSDYLVAPLCHASVAEAVGNLLNGEAAHRPGRVLAFIGAKGGVGSSTIACNTAWTLATSLDEDVALVDLDLAFGTVALAFNVDPRQGIRNALADRDRLDDVLLERYMPRRPDGLALLAGPASFDGSTEIESGSLASVLQMVRRRAPFVVLDLPHSWSSWARDTLAAADAVVVSATPDLAALRNAKLLMEGLTQIRSSERPVHYVLNQVGGGRKFDLTADEFSDALGGRPLAVIASEPATFAAAAARGQMIGEVAKGGRAAEAFRKLASALSGRAPGKPAGSALRRWVMRGQS